MPKPNERKRLKDRIVESISKAIKQVQRLQGGSEDVVLTNEDWQFHKLVGHLDHALMHGLKHITNGYWVVVQEFTPKSTIKEISYLQNVTTNLGRGRAWLYLALMDHLLESYIKCYMDNGGRVSRYYLKDALMLDTTQVEVIQTLASGLEFITFKLSLDVAYLDLSSHSRTKSQSCEEEDEGDRDSLASSSSTLSINTTPEVGVDVASLAGDLERDDSVPPLLHTSSSTPAFMNSSITESSSALLRGSPRLSLDMDKETQCAGLEVIRHKVKVKRRKEKKSVRTTDSDSLSSVDTGRVSVSPRSSPYTLNTTTTTTQLMSNVDSPLSPESGYKSVTDNSSPRANGHATMISEESHNIEKHTDKKSGSSSSSRLVSTKVEQTNDCLRGNNLVIEECKTNPSRHDTSTVQNSNPVHESLVDGEMMVLEKRSSRHSVNIVDSQSSGHAPESSLVSQNVETDLVNNVSSSQFQESGPLQSASLLHQSSSSCLSSCDSAATESSPVPLTLTDNPCDSDDAETLYGSGIYSKNPLGSNPDLCSASQSQESSVHSQHRVGIHQSSTASQNAKVTGNGSPKEERSHRWDLDVDNNTKLYLMLEVFHTEEEMLIKMFSTCLGHTEGDVVPVHLVITDSAIYLTTKGTKGSTHFSREAMVTFRELDYISLSLGYQVINIVCTNRRKKFWITTGNELMTKAIVGHIDNAIRHSDEDIPRLSVLTDATHQKIAIKKWAATEVNSQKNDLAIHDYSLVYWEDAETSSSSWLQVGATKSGTLHYKSHDAYFGFGGPVWKTAYFVLKDGALFMYNSNHDSLNGTPALKCIQLNYEECQGCRSCRNMDREYCLEILLRDGSSLQLAASDLTESQEWLQSLCQAVAQGMGDLPHSGGPVACCSVLIANRLLLCHEDVETNFMRTLAAANIIDVTSINVDTDVNNSYCVLIFDSPNHADQQKWVLYFNSCAGKDSFLTSLNTAWTKLFQVEFVVKTMEDSPLLKHCREAASSIRIQERVS